MHTDAYADRQTETDRWQAGSQTDRQTDRTDTDTDTYTDIRTESILRNQAHAGLRSWFKN